MYERNNISKIIEGNFPNLTLATTIANGSFYLILFLYDKT